MLLVAIFLALMVGVSLGLLGGGGSILTVPILRYVLGLPAHAAIAMSLLVVGATSAAALIPHARRGRVQWRTGFVFGGAAMIGAFAAGRVAHLVPAALLLAGLGAMMLFTAFAMLRPERAKSDAGAQAVRGRRARALPFGKISLEGFVVGAVTGLVGAGGGFLVVPALVLLGRLPMSTAIGTSLLIIALKSFAGFAGFLGHTEFDWSLALIMSSAAVLGSVGGAALTLRVSSGALRQSFAWFVVSMAFFILGQELPPLFGHASRPALALGEALLLTGALFAAHWLCRRRKRVSPAMKHVTLPNS
jgi:uncharacterized membrane protein YfcA